MTRLIEDAGTMLTKIFHPNISKSGEICVDTLKKGWKKEYGVGHVLIVSRIDLFYDSCSDDTGTDWRRMVVGRRS